MSTSSDIARKQGGVMRWIRRTYDWVLEKSEHRHAVRFLALVSFIESSIFPIPPDVMLIPMCLGARRKSWGYASLATIASVVGGVAGYVIGYAFFETLGVRIVSFYHMEAAFQNMQSYFQVYGVWFVIIAGFTPIPYKIFTIGAGVFQMALVPFVVASVIGRAGRFFLLAGLIYWMGPRVRGLIDRYFNVLVVLFAVLLIGFFLLLNYV